MVMIRVEINEIGKVKLKWKLQSLVMWKINIALKDLIISKIEMREGAQANNNWNESITNDPIEIKTIEKHYKQFYSNRFDNFIK